MKNVFCKYLSKLISHVVCIQFTDNIIYKHLKLHLINQKLKDNVSVVSNQLFTDTLVSQ